MEIELKIEEILLEKINNIVHDVYGSEVIFTEILPTPEFFEGDFTVSSFQISK